MAQVCLWIFNRTILNVGLQDLISIPDTTINQTVSPALSLTIPPGFNIVNEIEEHTMEIPGVELKIRVSNGTIDIDVYNPLSTPTTYSVNLPGVSKNGVEYSNSICFLLGLPLILLWFRSRLT